MGGDCETPMEFSWFLKKLERILLTFDLQQNIVRAFSSMAEFLPSFLVHSLKGQPRNT